MLKYTATNIFRLQSRSLTKMGNAQAGDNSAMNPIFGFEAKNIDGQNVSFEKYKGRVCLIVNVACK